MSKVFDKEDIIALLKRAVEAKGADYVDPHAKPGADGGCDYANEDGSPSCIVGHVFDYVGLDVSKLASGAVENEVLIEHKWYGDEGDEFVTFGTYRLDDSYYEGADINDPEVEFTPAAVSILATAQLLQDQGESWGSALERAVYSQ